MQPSLVHFWADMEGSIAGKAKCFLHGRECEVDDDYLTTDWDVVTAGLPCQPFANRLTDGDDGSRRSKGHSGHPDYSCSFENTFY